MAYSSVRETLLGVVAEREGGSEAAALGFEQRPVEVEVAAKHVDIFAHGAPVVAGGADAGAPDVGLVERRRGDVDCGGWVSKSSFVPTGEIL